MNLRRYGVLIGLLLLLVWAGQAEAACTGASPNWISTIDEASLSTCVNTNAQTGDTITVSAGSANWGTNGFPITSQPANLTIICAVQGACNVTGAGVDVTKTHGIRVSGFTFSCTGSSNVGANACFSFQGTNDFRFDHNVVNNADWSNPLACFWAIGSLDGSSSNDESYGVIDHNTFSACRILVWGEWGDTGGKQRWFAHGDIRGTKFNVYVEDNTYTVPSGTPGPGQPCQGSGQVLCNFIDAAHGGGVVARFNIITNSYFEHHSVNAWSERGTKNFEVYWNQLSLQAAFTPNFSRMFNLQASGSGIVFENHSSTNFSIHAISMNYIKRKNPGGESSDKCTGSNPSDGNTDGFGYPCLDQPGRGYDLAQMNTSTSVGQALQPFVFFNNDIPAGTLLVVLEDTAVSNIVHKNRDYYERDPSLGAFNGTVGVGVGTIGSRPGSCTVGVRYWATDQGEWNSTNGATADGQLYKCIAPGNAWALDYKPYTYPHPLQGAGGPPPDTTPPVAPQNPYIVEGPRELRLAGVH